MEFKFLLKNIYLLKELNNNKILSKLDKNENKERNIILNHFYIVLNKYGSNKYLFHYFCYIFDILIFSKKIEKKNFKLFSAYSLLTVLKLFSEKNTMINIPYEFNNNDIIGFELCLMNELSNNIYPYFLINFINDLIENFKFENKEKYLLLFITEIMVFEKNYFLLNKYYLAIGILYYSNLILKNYKITVLIKNFELKSKIMKYYIKLITKRFKKEIFKNKSNISNYYYQNDYLF